MTALVEVDGLCISARGADGVEIDIVEDVGFRAERGEVVALIGESGSGKTTTALALLGYARAGCRIRAGTVRVDDVDATRLTAAELPDFRGRRVAYVAQSAAASFNPGQRLIDQVIEGSVVRGLLGRAEAEAKAVGLFEALALPDPAQIGRRYPHQVSGGQLQRVMAAMALITDPALVVLDEPTTALDVTTQVEVLRAFRRVVRERDTTAVYVSHDLAVVAQMADQILVMRRGRVQEAGPTARLLASPSHPYTRSLLDAAPSMHGVPAAARAETATTPSLAPAVLEAEGLAASYGGPGGVPALRDVSLRLPAGAVLGVIGESGSGKSTLARVLTGLLPPHAGEIRLGGERLAPAAAQRSAEQLRRMQIVFQIADTALNPAHDVATIIARPLAFYRRRAGRAQGQRVEELLDMVHLPRTLARRRPADLSGGQKQRVNLARALAAEPTLLICDEVTSALDTVVGAAVLDLLAELRRALGLAMVFISHDLSTVRSIADEVMIMYAGRPVQHGTRAASAGPVHPYAALLARSVPELRPGWLDALPPSTVLAAPHGAVRLLASDACAFFPRCDRRIPGTCDSIPTPQRLLSTGAEIRCVRAEPDLPILGVPAPALEPEPAT